MSEAFWRRTMGADPEAIGRSVDLGRQRSDRAHRRHRASENSTTRSPRICGSRSPDSLQDRDRSTSISPIAVSRNSSCSGGSRRASRSSTARAELDVLSAPVDRAISRRLRLHTDIVVTVPLLDTVVGNTRKMLTFLLAAAALVFRDCGRERGGVVVDACGGAAIRIRCPGVALGASRSRLACADRSERACLIGGCGTLARYRHRATLPGRPAVARAGRMCRTSPASALNIQASWPSARMAVVIVGRWLLGAAPVWQQ